MRQPRFSGGEKHQPLPNTLFPYTYVFCRYLRSMLNFYLSVLKTNLPLNVVKRCCNIKKATQNHEKFNRIAFIKSRPFLRREAKAFATFLEISLSLMRWFSITYLFTSSFPHICKHPLGKFVFLSCFFCEHLFPFPVQQSCLFFFVF